jgi:hypothetical protein
MKSSRANRFRRSAAECLLAGIVEAVLTFVCFRLQVNLTIASLLYLTVVVLLSVTDAVIGSIFCLGRGRSMPGLLFRAAAF